MLAILWDGPHRPRDIVHAFAERGVSPDRRAIDLLLAELEAGAFVTGRGAGEQRVYAIAERGSDVLAAEADADGARG